MNKKKAFTLIEVVVALGILAAVFAGTVTMIVTVVRLALSARQKTEAVALAQRGLAKGIQQTYRIPASTYSTATQDIPLHTETVDGIIVTSKLEKPSPCFTINSSYSFDCNNFYHINSKATWSGQTYEIDQYIRKDGK